VRGLGPGPPRLPLNPALNYQDTSKVERSADLRSGGVVADWTLLSTYPRLLDALSCIKYSE